MQKFTIFTIIFSVIVVSITAELVIQDYLQKLYPPAETLQADSITREDFEVFVPDTSEPAAEDPEEDDPEEEEDRVTSKVKEILDRKKAENTLSSADETSSVKLLMPALNVDGVKFRQDDYPGRLFGLIETEDLDIRSVLYGLFTLSDTVIGSSFEMKFKTELDAEKAYRTLIVRGNNLDGVETNETNQFGERSFYINVAVKVNQVFILFQQDNFIYAFGYPTNLHEKFKAFFAVLV